MAPEPRATPDSTEADEVELLSFRLGMQEFCIEIGAVREIRGWTPPTPLPWSPGHVKGVINLRGTILPVIDLSLRLGMEGVECGERKVIVVTQLDGCSAGLLVDVVSDIVTVPATALQPPPDLGEETAAGCIRALTLIEGRLVRVLDLACVVPHGGTRAA